MVGRIRKSWPRPILRTEDMHNSALMPRALCAHADVECGMPNADVRRY
jgi:hypothetical protein